MTRARTFDKVVSAIPNNRKITHEAGLSNYKVDEQTPESVVFPNTLEEVSQLLAAADGQGKAVVPWGAGTQMRLGNLAGRVDLVAGTSRLNRILEYEPADLTVIVEGGISLGALQSELARHGQFLPLDPPGAENATIGGILACNTSGPRRAFFGTARDRLIGIKVVHPNGEVTKGGGRVVKNVTGYDMNKLYTGSLGTLGIIVEAAFKIAPLFKEEHTLIVSCSSAAEAVGIAREISNRGVLPLAMEILDERASGFLSSITDMTEGWLLVVELGGTSASVKRQEKEIGEVCKTHQVEHTSADDIDSSRLIWSEIRNLGRSEGHGATMIVKSTSLSSDTAALMGNISALGKEKGLEGVLLTNITHGITHSYWWADNGSMGSFKGLVDGLRGLADRFHGHAVVEVCPTELKREIDVWGVNGLQTQLMKRIKEQYDPAGTLNPGRFVDGI